MQANEQKHDVEHMMRALPARELGNARDAQIIAALQLARPHARFWTRRVPLWQAAACLAAGVGIGMLTQSNNGPAAPESRGTRESQGESVVRVRVEAPVLAQATPRRGLDISHWGPLPRPSKENERENRE